MTIDFSKFSWAIDAKKSPNWGRKTTKEEKEEMKKEKHTPGKKKKRGRSIITVDPSPGRYAGRSKPSVVEEKGKRCGKSFIAKEDECHVNDDKPKKGGNRGDTKAPKKPRTKTIRPNPSEPKNPSSPQSPDTFRAAEELPQLINSPEGGKGTLVEEGYLASGEDGIYAVGNASNLHRVYFPQVEDQAKAQYLSSAIAAIMGLVSPQDYLFRNTPVDDRIGAGHPLIPFHELDEIQLKKLARTNPEIAGWFVHSVLVRHDSVIGEDFNNMVLSKQGNVLVLHFGGTLLWTDTGEMRKDGMAPDKLDEIKTLRSPETNWAAAAVFGHLSGGHIKKAILAYLVHLQDKDILDLVHAASFEKEIRAEIGKGLVSRKHLLESIVGDNHG